jgi:uncharacterized protein (DUF58 family)
LTSRLQEQSEQLAAALPPLLVAAERLGSAVSLGVHGRRKAGMGETFWQFRRHVSEDPASAIDWRQSAKSQHLFVREREWEAAEAVWMWRDGSAGMRFQSDWTKVSKIDRATVLSLALCALLVRGGERIALLGDGHGPASGRAARTRRRIASTTFSPTGRRRTMACAFINWSGSQTGSSGFSFPKVVASSICFSASRSG